MSYDLWRSRFQGDPDIVGLTIDINRHPLTVIGVAPREFRRDLWRLGAVAVGSVQRTVSSNRWQTRPSHC